MATEAAIRDIVSEELQARLAKRGLVGSDIAFDEDFDGDKVVRVTAHFSRRGEDVSEPLFDAADAIRARLIKGGDDRFVFVRRVDPESSDEIGAEEEAERSRTS